MTSILNKKILIKNGTLNDAFLKNERKDILISNGKIIKIKENILIKEDTILIDATNKIICPGFIDIHSHSDFYLPLKDHNLLLEGIIKQGITTVVGGNCGLSAYPVLRKRFLDLKSYYAAFEYKALEYNWQSLDDYLKIIEGKILLNYVPLVGHGTIRINCTGFRKKIDEIDINKMKKVLTSCMDQGCSGLSSGLMYSPGAFADTDEIIKLVKILNNYKNSIYASHMRGYSDTLIESLKEIIKVGEETGVKIECSHLTAFGAANVPKITQALNIIEDARKRGVDIGFDVLPYCGGSTTIMSLFPPSAYKEGITKFLEKIKDNKFYNKVIYEIENFVPRWPTWEHNGWTDNFVHAIGWNNIYIMGLNNNTDLIGKNFQQISIKKKKDIWETLREILIEENANILMYYYDIGGCIGKDDTYLNKMVEHPLSALAIDALYTKGDGRSMANAYGGFTKLIDYYVKKRKRISLQEAIKKATYLVAERFGLKNRGLLKEGYFADIVIFDFDEIRDNPKLFYEEPEFSTGIYYLLINGCLVIENKIYNTDIHSGMVIRNQ